MRGLCSIQMRPGSGPWHLLPFSPLSAFSNVLFMGAAMDSDAGRTEKSFFFLESGAHKFVEALFDPTVRALQSGHVRPSTVCHFVLRATQTAAKMPASQRLVRPIIHRLFYILRCKASWSDWPRGQNVGLGLEHLASFNINRFHLYIVVLWSCGSVWWSRRSVYVWIS